MAAGTSRSGGVQIAEIHQSRTHHGFQSLCVNSSPPAGAVRQALQTGTLVLALTPGDFYKSMTTFADHTIWQDVYRPKTPAGDVYLKLTVIDDVLIVSFKEL